MPLVDGATTMRKKLASEAGVTEAVAVTMSGADLEFARSQRKAGGTFLGSGADVEQASVKPNIIRAGELNYAAVGGKVTRIIGQNFTGATGVTFGGTAGTAFSVIDDETVQVTTPAKAAGTYDLVVQHPDGNATRTNGVTYV